MNDAEKAIKVLKGYISFERDRAFDIQDPYDPTENIRLLGVAIAALETK